MIGLKFKNQGMFFDSPKVILAVDKATRRVFSRFGAFVRRSAKSSIRRRKRISTPGQPPSSHTGLLKKFIWFGYEPSNKSVVIGPVMLNSKSGNAPEALEHGGMSIVLDGLRKNRKKRKINIAARPFMGPAFEKEKLKLPAMWKDSVGQ